MTVTTTKTKADNEGARYQAQRLAFSPLLFQACRVLRDCGVLGALIRARRKGLTANEAVARCEGVTHYAASMLLEAGLAAGLCTYRDEPDEPRFFVTAMGAYWLNDPLTLVNTEFAHHVCYLGATELRAALLQGYPAGLPHIDSTGAATVYEALRTLPPEVKRAWFEFDHHYSDGVFETALDEVFTTAPRQLIDLGANTGRFARLCLERGVARLGLVDLPQQLAVAKENLRHYEARAHFYPLNLLEGQTLPPGADVYWMSQFLDCFGEAEIRLILQGVRQAMRPDSRVYILETFWNRQRFDAARLCVIGTSLYFACIANGRSRMYHADVIKRLAREAGLVTVKDQEIGLAHTLLTLAAG